MKFAAARLDQIKPSPSAWVSQAANAAKAAGQDVIDLGLGEPDFETPTHIIKAAHRAALNGETRYSPTNGTFRLRHAVVDKLARENQLSYGLDEVIVSNGAKQVLFNAMMATLEAGDEVLLCAPYFGQHKDIVLILGGAPVALTCPATAYAMTGWRIRYGAVPAALTALWSWPRSRGQVSAYELEPYFRISTAASKAVLTTAMERLAKAVNALKPKETL